MISANAMSMAGPTVGLVLFSIYLADWPFTGLMPDLVFDGWSVVVIGMRELVFADNRLSEPHP